MSSEKDIQKLLRENIRLTRENNRLLRKLNRARVMGMITKSIYFVFIVIAMIAGWYAVQPYLDTAQEAYQGIQQGLDSVTETRNNAFQFLDGLGGSSKDSE